MAYSESNGRMTDDVTWHSRSFKVINLACLLSVEVVHQSTLRVRESLETVVIWDSVRASRLLRQNEFCCSRENDTRDSTISRTACSMNANFVNNFDERQAP